MAVGAETLFERIGTVECINRTLLKWYDRLTYRMSLQEGKMHAMVIMSKDELDIISTGQTLYLRILHEGIRAEYWTGGLDFQKALVNRFEKIEGIISFDDQEQKV